MRFDLHATEIPDVVVVQFEEFADDRGFFREIYRQDLFAALGLPAAFVQINQSGSRRGVVRGLHFQWDPPMGKLMRVTAGEAFLVAVDIRQGSPTLGRWIGRTLNAESRQHIWAPAGFARGFCVTSDWAEVEYLCTGTYNGGAEGSIRWNDPEVGVDWPVREPVLSTKDRDAPSFREWLDRPEAARFAI